MVVTTTIPTSAAAAAAGEADDAALHAAIQYAILQVLDLNTNNNNTATKKTTNPTQAAAISTLTHLTQQYAQQVLAPELPRFCAHAGRKRITPSDVWLVLRRAPAHISSQLLLLDTAEETRITTNPVLPRTTAIPRARRRSVQPNHPALDADSDSSSSDEEEVRKISTTRSLLKRAMETSSEDEDQERILPTAAKRVAAPIAPAAKSKSRFRLPAVKNDDDESSSSEEEAEFQDIITAVHHPTNNQKKNETTTIRNKKKMTTTQQFMANLSQDSLLSNDDDTH